MSRGFPIRWVCDDALRIDLSGPEGAFSEAASARVRAASDRVGRAGLVGLRDLTPAYGTLLATFRLEALDAPAMEARVRELVADLGSAACPPSRLVEIPVCYEGDHAPDLEEVARHAGLPAHQVADLHRGAAYVVRFLGFSPGFPYLAGLPPRIAAPRRPSPRLRVPAGSVGIAGGQTGIYPQETPGGWRLIGRTPLCLFDARREPPALLALGDRVRFTAIGSEEFRRMATDR